jgi:DNA-directed RNA polymerase subunit E'/Rpb7
METIEIIANIVIFPHMLSNINEHIYSELIKRYNSKWTEEYGYIFKISPDFDIISNIIQRDNMRILFRVRCRVERIKPEEGMRIVARVDTVIPNGIFVSYMNCMHILINKTSFNGVYNKETGSFSVDDRVIMKGSEIEVEITKYMWAKDKYSVIGKLVQ